MKSRHLEPKAESKAHTGDGARYWAVGDLWFERWIRRPMQRKRAPYCVREQFKQCDLAVHYGMAAKALEARTGQLAIRAHEL